jgi:hypothetical protein
MAREDELQKEIDELKDEIAVLKSRLERSERKASISSIGDLSQEISNPFDAMVAGTKKVSDGFQQLGAIGSSIFVDIRKAATDAAAQFGTGLKNYESISQEIAKVLPDLTRLGFDASEIGDMQEEFTSAIKTNVVLSSDALKNIGILDKLGADGAAIAVNFRNSAQSVSGMIDELEVAGQIAGDYGVNASKIFKDIETTMQTTNQYRFENGVEGISRMAAQTAIMGINFQSVVGFADKVMDPQGAIETVAALQRLGVAASGLQDPFKLMYMAQSDMEGLTEEIGKSVSNLATFNKETGKLEIPPSARMAMKEIGSTLNLSAEEMNKMVSQQAKFNAMAGDFEGLGVSEEDRMMISNLAEFNKETGQFEVKVGGETKAVTELNSDDLEALKERPKTLEDAAMQQLDYVSAINNNVASILNSLPAAAAATKVQFDSERLARGTFEAAGDVITKSFKDAKIREEVDSFTKELGGSLDDIISALSSGDAEKIRGIFDNLSKVSNVGFEETFDRFKTTFGDSLSKVPQNLSDILGDENIYMGLGETIKGIINNFGDQIKETFNQSTPTTSPTGVETPKVTQPSTQENTILDYTLTDNFSPINPENEVQPAQRLIDRELGLSQQEYKSLVTPTENEVQPAQRLIDRELGLSQQEYKSLVTPTENEVPPAQRLMDRELSLSQQDYASLATLEIPKNEVPPTQREINRELSLSQQDYKSLVTPPAVTDVTNILNNQTNNTQALTSIQPIAPREIATQQAQANATPVANEEKEIRVKFDPFIVKLEGDGKSIEMALQDNVVRDKIIDMVGKAMTSDYNTMGRPILGNRA